MSLIQTIKNHITKQTKLGQELLALPSVLSYPDMYLLGKRSLHMKCTYCGQSPDNYMDAQYIEAYGFCVRCDGLLSAVNGGDL